MSFITFPAFLMPGSQQLPFKPTDKRFSRTTETQVSVFPGVLFRYFRVSCGVALSPMVIDIQAIQLLPYQPTLAESPMIPDFSRSPLFSPAVCPLGLSVHFRLGR